MPTGQQLVLSVPGVTVSTLLAWTTVPNSQFNNVNLNGNNFIRLDVDANLTGLQIKVQYSLNGTTWEDLASTTILGDLNSALSRWFDIPQEAKTEVSLRAQVFTVASCKVRFVDCQFRG